MSENKEIRKRIKSIQNTAKITHAMELVAAAKMRRAQIAAAAGKPYSNLVNKVIRSIADRVDPESHPLLIKTNRDKGAVIFFSSDRGLAGALNSNLFKELDTLIGELKFITIGKKAKRFIIKTGRNLIADFPLPEKADLSLVRSIAKLTIDCFLNNEFDRVILLYTEFVSTITQFVRVKQLLPIIDKQILEELIKETPTAKPSEPLFEPDPDTVLETILPQYILMELYQTLLESKASEHSARMVAMKNATENALELVDDLTLTYNSIRQESITKEILDIATASSALE